MGKKRQILVDLDVLLDNPSPMLIASESGEIVMANSFFEQSTDFKAGSLSGKNLSEVLEGGEKNPFLKNLKLKLLRKKSWKDEMTFETGVVARSTIVPSHLTDEKELHFAVRPESFQRGSENNMRLLQDKKILQAVSSNLNEGVYRSTESGQIIYANNAMLKIFGYDSIEEIKEIHLSEVYVDPNKRAEVMNKLTEFGEVVNEEVLLKRKNKEIFWGLLGTTRSVTEDGTVVYDGVIRNITTFKELENRLREEKRKAEEAARTKEQFLSIMSHELRTPMNAVIGITDLLLRDNPQDHQIENLKTLQFSADNLLHLINDILDFSKIEAGKVDFETITFNFRDLIEKVFESFKPKVKSKKIAYKLELDEDVPTFLKGDPTRLSQILNNLISNALKFTYEGEIKVTVRSVGSNPNLHNLAFEVSDTGIGINQKQINHIFHMFTQANSSTSREFGGTGLGLTITKMLVELLGGKIDVVSEPNRGSKFSFQLHFDKANKDKAKKKPEEGEPDLSHLSILVVEDNKVNQLVLEKYLKIWKAKVHLASGGNESIQIFRENKIDIVLMDLQMPGVDGYSASEEILKYCREKGIQEVPILAVTASSMSEVKKKVVEAGMLDSITKPFSPKELHKKILRYTST
ncbi:ATP-binding protein [Halocola ammonii]